MLYAFGDRSSIHLSKAFDIIEIMLHIEQHPEMERKETKLYTKCPNIPGTWHSRRKFCLVEWYSL